MIFPDDPQRLADLEKQARQIAEQIKCIKGRAQIRLEIGHDVVSGASRSDATGER